MRTFDNQTARQIAVRGEQLYRDRIPSQELAKHREEYVAIDPDSGRYAFGRTLGEAVALLSTSGPVPLPFVRLVGMTLRLKQA